MCNADKSVTKKNYLGKYTVYISNLFCTSGGFISFLVAEEKEAPRIITSVIRVTTTFSVIKS